MDKIDEGEVQDNLRRVRVDAALIPFVKSAAHDALTLIDQLTAERDALQAKVDAMRGAMVEAAELLNNIGVAKGAQALTKLKPHLPKPADPVEQAITSWLYESGYEGNAEVEQALRQLLALAPEAAADLAARGGTITFPEDRP